MRFPLVILDGDRITARGRVTHRREAGGERLADCDIWLDREGHCAAAAGQGHGCPRPSLAARHPPVRPKHALFGLVGRLPPAVPEGDLRRTARCARFIFAPLA